MRLALMMMLLFYVIAYIYLLSDNLQFAVAILALWIVIVSNIHSRRSDKKFLQINIPLVNMIYISEYLIISIPIIVCFLLNKQWMLSLCLVIFCLLINKISINARRKSDTLNSFILKRLPFKMFEWKSGVRQFHSFLIIVWLLGATFSFFEASVPLCIFIIGTLVCEFYKRNESWQILLCYQKNSDKLLYSKIKQYFLLYTVINLPLIIIYLFFHIELWYIVCAEYIIFLSIHTYCIFLKYAYYDLNKSETNSVFMLIGFFIGLIPITTPVLWIVSIYLMIKSRNNLKFYLNDYN
jgi:hypothetical protein